MRRDQHLNLLAAACLAVALPAGAQETADRIWTGGPIFTMNDKAIPAEAMAERGGKIVAVGAEASVMKLRGPRTARINLNGQPMLAEFVDAQGHMFIGGVQALSAGLWSPLDGNVKNIDSVQTVVREWLAANDAAVKRAGLIAGFG